MFKEIEMYNQYLPLTKDEIENIWENGLIVLDTNILLHLYRYNEELREKLLSILDDKNINGKIWIPCKVYEEFLRNRPKVICEQWDIEQKVTSTIKKRLNDLKQEIGKHFSRRFHPYIDPEELSDNIDILQKDILKKITEIKDDKYKIHLNDDDLLIKIQKLVEEKIGKCLTDDELQEIYREGKDRFSKKIPPGYKDEADKTEPDCYADLVIWKSIINKSKEGKGIIFVIDDKKEDWWRIEKGRTIGPQPELLKEFITETGNMILFYDSSRFYNYVDEYIAANKVDITEEENKQIKTTSLEEFLKKYDQENEKLRNNIRIGKRKRKPKKRYSENEILDWFWENYVDPADGVPYDSGEGGYQYFHGGPYYANDEIQEQFPDIDNETLNSVLNEIHDYGTEWIKKGQY